MAAITQRTHIDRMVAIGADQLAGFTVEAVDGDAGTVSREQGVVDDTHLIIHLDGFLGLVGKDVSIEGEAIREIDLESRTVVVDRVREWVNQSPRV